MKNIYYGIKGLLSVIFAGILGFYIILSFPFCYIVFLSSSTPNSLDEMMLKVLIPGVLFWIILLFGVIMKECIEMGKGR